MFVPTFDEYAPKGYEPPAATRPVGAVLGPCLRFVNIFLLFPDTLGELEGIRTGAEDGSYLAA